MRKMFSKKQIEEMVEQGSKEVVQADKEVISKIRSSFDGEQTTTFYFPKGIIPLFFGSSWEDSLYILDSPFAIVDFQKTIKYIIEDFYFDENGCSILVLQDENSEEIEIEDLCGNGLTYINFDGRFAELPKSYYMVYPPHIYKHIIDISSGDQLIIYSSNSSIYTKADLTSLSLDRVVSMYYFDESTEDTGLVLTKVGLIFTYFSANDNEIVANDITSETISDEVTPL